MVLVQMAGAALGAWFSASVIAQDISAASAPVSLESRLAAVQSEAGHYHVDTIGPLVALGISLSNDGRHDEALERFKEAQHIVHRHDGVHSLAQVELLAPMVDSYLSLGRLDEADSVMRFHYDVHRSNYGAHDPRTVPSMLELASWHQSLGRFDDARDLYRDAISILEDNGVGGKPLHRSMSLLLFTDYLEGRCCNESLISASIDELLRDDEVDFAERSRAMSMAGDAFIMGGEAEMAAEMYTAANTRTPADSPVWLGISRGDRMVRAYGMLLQHRLRDTRLPQKSPIPPGQLIGAPLAFCEAQLSRLVPSSDYRDFEIELSFVVGDDGRPRHIELVSSNANSAVDVLSMRLLRTSRFRPVVRDGEVVEERMQMTQRFDANANIDGSATPFPPANTAVFHACQGLARLY